MFLYDGPPMTPELVHKYVDEIAATPVTTLFISAEVGMVKNYPSKTVGMLGDGVSRELAAGFAEGVQTAPASLERVVQNLRSLVAAGHDPLGVVVDRAREKGLEVFLSTRLNEVHAVEQADSLLFSKFWKEHPEWRIGKAGDPVPQVYLDILGPNTSPIVASWLPGGLNFAIPEVRAYKLAEIREDLETHNADGLELDFQRFPMYFKPGEEAQQVAAMTAWVREVRALTREFGDKRKRPLMLSARILATPEQNLAIGLDPAAWAHEGLLDFVVVSHYLRNDYPLPVEQFREMLPPQMPIYASIEVAKTRELYLELGGDLVARGVDGLSVFNFFTTRENGNEPPFDVLHELGAMYLKHDEGGAPRIAKSSGPAPATALLIVNKHEDTMAFIDPVNLTEFARVTTGHDPHELVITPDQRYAYLSNYEAPGNTVSLIDLVEKKHLRQIPTGEFTRIHSAAIAPDGKFVYFTAGQTGYVVEISTETNEVTRGIPTHGKISHMVVVSPDGARLYTANIETQNVSVIDRASGELIAQIPCEAGCEGLMFTPDGRRLWAANQNAGSICIIDPVALKVEKTLAVPGMPLRVRFTQDGARALVTSWVEQGELVVIDVATLTEIKRVPVGNQPIGVEISPDQSRAFVTNMTSNDVHVIDLTTLEVVAHFSTGLGSDAMGWWTPPRNWRE